MLDTKTSDIDKDFIRYDARINNEQMPTLEKDYTHFNDLDLLLTQEEEETTYHSEVGSMSIDILEEGRCGYDNFCSPEFSKLLPPEFNEHEKYTFQNNNNQQNVPSESFGLTEPRQFDAANLIACQSFDEGQHLQECGNSHQGEQPHTFQFFEWNESTTSNYLDAGMANTSYEVRSGEDIDYFRCL